MACKQTKRHLERRGIAYDEFPIDSDEQVLAAVKELGFTQAPVVAITQTWDGYRPDRIEALLDADSRATGR